LRLPAIVRGLVCVAALLGAWTASAETAPPAGKPYLEDLRTRARDARLAETRAWLTLGHWKPTLLGTRSEADSRGFFLSPDGRGDPAAELDATLAAFFAPLTEAAQHPQCRFPARYALLKERLAFDPDRLPEIGCVRFEEWRRILEARGATLLFSSAYMNSPASMYGHTFLRLDRDPDRTGPDRLTDYTVNFSADAWTSNPILYALLGLGGGFDGRFSTLPYYMKVQEYSNVEHRDLWEYPLRLTDAQLDRLVRHLWELGSTTFDYFFMTENCSYQLLTLLEAAAPELHLAPDLRVKVIPVDTLRALQAVRGLVGPVALRPSHVRVMMARRSGLSAFERSRAVGIAEGAHPAAALDDLPRQRRAPVLDAALDLVRYQHGLSRTQRPREVVTRERAILVARGRLGVASTPPRIDDPPSPPEATHASGRMGLGFGVARGRTFEELAYRGAMHDALDAQEGYVEHSTLEMGHFRLRVENRGAAALEEATFIRIVSFMPLDEWIRKPSWRFELGGRQAHWRDCADAWGCFHGGLRGGLGVSGPVVGKRLLLSAMLDGAAEAGGPFRDDYRIGAGFTAGLLLEAGHGLRAQVEWGVLAPLAGDDVYQAFLRGGIGLHLSRNFALRGHVERALTHTEALLSLVGFL
jgi:hypothetical protein